MGKNAATGGSHKNRPRAGGYSGTPLPRKLEIKEGTQVALVNGPKEFRRLLGTLPRGAALRNGIEGARDLTIWFVRARQDVEHNLQRVAPRAGEGSLWMAWPKKSSGVPTDVSEDVLREVILPHGLVDRKVCAIDQTWSGLLFSWRRK
jgi:hypothetical protein